MGRFLQLATFHEGIFFLTAYTNVAKGNKLHIEDLVRAVGARGGGRQLRPQTFFGRSVRPGICVKYFLPFPQKTCHHRKLRKTKCILFNF